MVEILEKDNTNKAQQSPKSESAEIINLPSSDKNKSKTFGDIIGFISKPVSVNDLLTIVKDE